QLIAVCICMKRSFLGSLSPCGRGTGWGEKERQRASSSKRKMLLRKGSRMRISRELEITLTLAIKEARRRRHEFLCLEHVLYALLFDETVANIIRQCGGDVKALQRDLEKFFKENLEQLPTGVEAEPQQTLGLQPVLQR